MMCIDQKVELYDHLHPSEAEGWKRTGIKIKQYSNKISRLNIYASYTVLIPTLN